MNNSPSNRSPLKARPLRYAGQSLDEEIERQVDEGVLVWLIWASVAVFWAAWEWWRYLSGNPPDPWPYTALAVAAVAIAAWKISSTKRKLKNLRLGRDGERIVGQFLEDLRGQGFRVLHDIPGSNFNVDHVLIGDRGIFTVETKTISKPARDEPKVVFDGESVLVNGFLPDRNCVTQARAQASWLGQLIAESTGRKFPVRGVVLFPGWYVDGPPKGTRADVWVLNPKALSSFIEHERQALTAEEVSLVSYHLARYVRSEGINRVRLH